MDISNSKIAVVGLGYVGLPLTVEFARHYPTLGFDINVARVDQLSQGRDNMMDLTPDELAAAIHGSYSSDPDSLAGYNVYIVTVPTPVDRQNQPDLTALKNACNLVGHYLSDGDTVIFESTVYPGCTEEICVPILENVSGGTFNRTFLSAILRSASTQVIRNTG